MVQIFGSQISHGCTAKGCSDPNPPYQPVLAGIASRPTDNSTGYRLRPSATPDKKRLKKRDSL